MVYDESMNVIENPDMTRGCTHPVMTRVHHERKGGRWITTHNGRVIDYDGDIPDGVEHEPFDEEWWHLTYVPYTPEELAEAAESAAKAEQREALLDALPDILAEQNAALCGIYEHILGGEV